MQKIKEYLWVLFYPILLLITQFIIIFIFTLFFNLNTTNEVGTIIYEEQLAHFLNQNKVFIVLITFLILIIFLLKKIKNKLIHINLKNTFFLIILGICFSITFNLFLYSINKLYYFTNLFDNTNTSIIVALITTGILGPILEEIVFRGIVYEKLKKLFPTMSIWITGLLFGLFHGNIIQFIYAFIFNIILIKFYEKYKSIYAPIIIHISANSGLILLLPFIKRLNFGCSLFYFLIFFTTLIIFYKLMYKKENNG